MVRGRAQPRQRLGADDQPQPARPMARRIPGSKFGGARAQVRYDCADGVPGKAMAVGAVGAVGAVVSDAASVVTLTVLLAADILPAASLAFTVKLYAVEAVNPVTAKVVAVVVEPFKVAP